MSFIDWNEKFDLKNDKINTQHKEILRLINLIFDMKEEKKNIDEIVKVIDELATYTIMHFKEEEEYMQSIKFPQFELHKGVHENLLKRLENFILEVKQQKVIKKELMDFLRGWITSHILHIDKKYSLHAESESKVS